MNMQTKQLAISAISAAITQKLSDQAFMPSVTSIEPYEQDEGLFSITGIVGIEVKIDAVPGLDATHVDVAFECLFKDCKIDKKTLEYTGGSDNYQFVIGELDHNLTLATTTGTPDVHDWRYQELSNPNGKDRSDITKAALSEALARLEDSRKKELLVGIFEILKKESPVHIA
ncbi:hypothetical protein [Psychrobacter sp. UBA3480]|uniref:hypothetical protein n=1 Tax=Psychrobacter sp. UBA3480 TaxID=1947350 RepID=UPI0025CDEA2A|nr:hypothetical protein [Psychrobacter sp. UBA3480]